MNVSTSSVNKSKNEAKQVDVIKQMIDKNCEKFQTSRPFDKAQYHQCMPNPVNETEMITV